MTSGTTDDDPGRWIRDALERFERPLTGYAQRLLGDLERARDAVQETFLRLCKQERDKVEEHLAQWLFTVCRNQTLDVLRKESRMAAIDTGPDGEGDTLTALANHAAPAAVWTIGVPDNDKTSTR